MIRVEHLTKRYRTVAAIGGLSFEVGPGRVAGPLGPNRAGETTTLPILLILVEDSVAVARETLRVPIQRARTHPPRTRQPGIRRRRNPGCRLRRGTFRALSHRTRSLSQATATQSATKISRIGSDVDYPAPVGPRAPATRPGPTTKLTPPIAATVLYL
jgi:ATPase subunit of ABC transporter with duplicated ATPase domains